MEPWIPYVIVPLYSNSIVLKIYLFNNERLISRLKYLLRSVDTFFEIYLKTKII